MNRFKNILCVVESNATNKAALERAVSLAENNQASLTVTEVIERVTAGIGMPEGGPISIDLQDAMKRAHTEKLETLVEPFRKRIAIGTQVLAGVPFLEIIRDVLRNERDLVIKIPEPLNWLDRLFGSDDMHLLRKCPCPVWLIKPKAAKAWHRILAAVDIDDNHPEAEQAAHHALNRQILEMASSLALSDFAELHIGHAWDAPGENTMHSPFVQATEKQITDYVEQVRREHEASLDKLVDKVISRTEQDTRNYLKPHTHLVKGWARKVIPALVTQIDADLVIMGTVARTGIPGFIMGNTAETILNQINCSVLAIKPPGFTSPVTLED